MRRLAVILAVLAVPAAGATAPPEAGRADLAALLVGVGRIAAPGAPGPLCVFGEAAFAVVVGGSGGAAREPVVAAARWGRGRVVAFGHDGYVAPATLAQADTGRLFVSAVRWAAGAAAGPGAAAAPATGPAPAAGAAPGGPRVAVLRQPGLLGFLQKQGLAAEALDGPSWRDGLRDFRALCLDPVSLSAEADFAAVATFVKGGGGLVAVGLGWGWLQLNPGKTLADHPANRLLAPVGIVWADGTLEPTAEGGYAAGAAPPALCHAGRALDAVAAHADGRAPLEAADLAQASRTLTRAVRSVPPADALFLPRLRRLREAHAAETVPTRQKPLTAGQPLGRLLLALDVEEARRLPPEEVRPHPAAAAFPGPVPADAPRVTRAVEIDTAVAGWHSTGLYAPPGEVLAAAVPEAAAGKGLALRIGSHSDTLWHLDAWRRCPQVTHAVPLRAAETRAAGAFGGLVYVDVPRDARLGRLALTVRGAVEAPYFVLGRTTPAEWRQTVRGRPAPWAELATSKVVLTLPADAVRRLDDPEDLMTFWDRVLDACADLAARPRDRPRPERLVADVQISAGYMHSGYPIMTLLDMPPVMVDKARMLANGHGGVWGLWHELGHNHQAPDWTFAGTGEVTVNLFSLYVMDTVCGIGSAKAHGAISEKGRARAQAAYFGAGPDFEKWKQDPFLALIMYMQVQEAFGWEPFKAVFAEYRDLARGDRPRSDDQKRDQWLVRLSRRVGRNLGPFFAAWGVPTSDAARASVADLAPWMPAGFPPKP